MRARVSSLVRVGGQERIDRREMACVAGVSIWRNEGASSGVVHRGDPQDRTEAVILQLENALMICPQLVHLLPVHLCPEVFTQESNHCQVVFEHPFVLRVPLGELLPDLEAHRVEVFLPMCPGGTAAGMRERARAEAKSRNR